MAMLPFCGYNMGDYFNHWLSMGRKMIKPPKIFCVNWFRTDEDGKFMWPGFGENLRVIEWILDRCNNEVSAVETPIGYIPKKEDIDLNGLDLEEKVLDKLLAIDSKEWFVELESQKEFFDKFGKKLPNELWGGYNQLKKRLKKD